MRAILFDFLWTFGVATHAWAERSIARVERWDDLASDPEREAEACDAIRRHLAGGPPGVGGRVTPSGSSA